MHTRKLRITAPSRIVALLKKVPSFDEKACERTMREMFFSPNSLLVKYGSHIYDVSSNPNIYHTYSF